MKIIVPCAGKSSRFPGLRPKWMLTDPDGNMMLTAALRGIPHKDKDIVVTILKEHEEKYGVAKGIHDQLGKDITICMLDKPTESQSETVYETLKKAGIKEDFLVKDSDNYFEFDSVPSNMSYVTCADLNKISRVNPSNKSYVLVNENNMLINIVEKKVISNFFSIGGYYFKHPELFKKAFEELSKSEIKGEMYLSNIISYMISKNMDVFTVKEGKNYIDWGTLEDWNEYKKHRNVFIVDIDGVIMYNGSKFFKPFWGEKGAIANNVETINALYAGGSQILLLTTRDEDFRKQTEEQLKKCGLKYHKLIMGCNHGKRVVVNDYSDSNPYPTAIGVNLPRDSEDLRKFLHEFIK